MRGAVITLAVFAVLAAAGPALASPAQVYVRIEGKTSTLFEGPIVTDGRNVQAVSERSSGAVRRCDGTNGGASPTVVPTATAAAVDAMSIAGQGFDGRWYPDINDYFIRAFGADAQAGGAYWGLFVGGAATEAGGCQTAVDGTKEVLWVYDAFRGRPLLSLAAPTTASAGSATAVTVARGSGTAPLSGASITSSPAASIGPVNDSGSASVTFPSDGWYRLKATGASFIRSNRQYVCVGACGAAPADYGVRTPPAPVFYGPGGAALGSPAALSRTTTALRLGRVRAGSSAYARGRIAVRWSITQQGPGLLRWSIAADDLSTTPRQYRVRARGTTGASSLVQLPSGRTYALRFSSIDRLRGSDAASAGRVVVPIDDRSRAVRRAGAWSKRKAADSWLRTVLRGRPGARLRVKLVRGRPVLLLRGRGGKARTALHVTAGRTARTITVRAAKRGSHQFVRVPIARKRTGTVTVRVARGTVDLDGVAAGP